MRPQRLRPFVLLCALALVGAACGSGAGDNEAAFESATTVREAQPPTAQPAAAPIDVVHPAAVDIDVTTVVTTAQGPIVPDFTLTLANGETFDLAKVTTPLYVMFWAEW